MTRCCMKRPERNWRATTRVHDVRRSVRHCVCCGRIIALVRRRKRLRKKVHALYLADMRLDISLSSAWRERLFASSTGTTFRINAHDVRSRALRRAIRRLDLRYAVQVVHPHPPARATASGLVRFTFSSVEFPATCRSSWNNPSGVTREQP